MVNSQINENIPECINLKYKDNTYKINLNELELKFDVKTAVDNAYEIGRTQNVVKDLYDYVEVLNKTVNIDAELQYNNDAFNKCINSIEEQLPDKVKEVEYNIENDKLIIHNGKNGITIDCEKLKEIIIDNLKNREYDKIIDIPINEVLPKPIDIIAIHNSIYVEPQDAYYTENPIKVYKEVIGLDFDTTVAQQLIERNPNLEKYEIQLILNMPNVFLKDLNVFPDVLATFSTHYSNNVNRTTNLSIAASKINGTVLMPGEKFSFNEVVGERTVFAGYKNAAIFVNGQVEDGLAGGICQVSSTLYNAVIGSNLEIVERHNHSKLTSYLPGGKDATVVWGRYDFQFKNNREYPIRIDMSVQNGLATATILGIKSLEEYEINIESQRIGIAGIYSVYNAYKVYKLNGIEQKREFLSRDLYK